MQKLNKISLVVTGIHVCHSNTKGAFNTLSKLDLSKLEYVNYIQVTP